VPSTTTDLFLRQRPAFLIGLLALTLRLVWVLIVDPSPDFTGGDANWYMFNGRELVTTGKTPGPLQTAPIYPVALGIVQVLIPGESSGRVVYTQAEMQAVRVLQAIMGAAMCWFVYTLTRRLFSARAGALAAVLLAISPALIIEAGSLSTESFFMFFVFGGLALYVAAQQALTPRALVWTGALFGLATLTRAVFLLFPLGLVLHLFLINRAHWRRLALALVVSYGLVISTWSVYNWLAWERLVIGGEGFLSLAYQGATHKASPDEADEELDLSPENADAQRDEALREGVQKNIFENPGGWARHRARELAGAYLQPHGTVSIGGKSLKEAVRQWITDDHGSPGGLADLVREDTFWPKLALYIFHFGGLILGAAGMWVFRRRWRDLFSAYGIIGYFTAIHLVLLALPRYLFPLYPVFWIFAAALMWDGRNRTHPA
jgi:4-amino-4-deoxy-L-arabinose transferase-like glycosyltransferase